MNKEFCIVSLPKEEWKGTPIPLTTRSDSYYDFEIDPSIFSLKVNKKDETP